MRQSSVLFGAALVFVATLAGGCSSSGSQADLPATFVF